MPKKGTYRVYLLGTLRQARTLQATRKGQRNFPFQFGSSSQNEKKCICSRRPRDWKVLEKRENCRNFDSPFLVRVPLFIFPHSQVFVSPTWTACIRTVQARPRWKKRTGFEPVHENLRNKCGQGFPLALRGRKKKKRALVRVFQVHNRTITGDIVNTWWDLRYTQHLYLPIYSTGTMLLSFPPSFISTPSVRPDSLS